MTRLICLSAFAVAAALTASCAPTTDLTAAGDGGARSVTQCFSTGQVRNFRAGNSGQLYLRVMRDQVFELNTSGGCTELDFAQRMAITPAGAGLAGGRICTGEWAQITLPGSAPALGACRARVDRALSEEEVAALPPAHRP
jgi:hypothetical protein